MSSTKTSLLFNKWTESDHGLTRRRALLAVGSGITGFIAGCAGLRIDESVNDQSYTELDATAVYVAEGVDLSLPEEVPSVSEPYNAHLVVLPDNSVIGPDQAVEWLADHRVVDLIGPDAEDTWLDWIRSDAFADSFDIRGYSDANPDPYLLVAAAMELQLPTYRHSWGGTPRDGELLRALDEDLAVIESRTST